LVVWGLLPKRLVVWRAIMKFLLFIYLFIITDQIWNDFKNLNSKLLKNNENGEEEIYSNSNKIDLNQKIEIKNENL
jgi:hypothetical protein